MERGKREKNFAAGKENVEKLTNEKREGEGTLCRQGTAGGGRRAQGEKMIGEGGERKLECENFFCKKRETREELEGEELPVRKFFDGVAEQRESSKGNKRERSRPGKGSWGGEEE